MDLFPAVALAVSAGAIAAFNPCGFALLPAYLALFLGEPTGRRAAVSRALGVGLAVTVGFVLVFGVAGLLVTVLAIGLGDWLSFVTIASGVLLVAVGLLLLSGREFAVNAARIRLAVDGTPRGMVFSPQGDKLYICVMGGDTLAEVDVEAGHVVARQIYCGQNPRHAVLSPDGSTIYVSNNIPGTITYVDRIAGTVLATVKVGNKARTIAITPDGAYLFVCNYDDSTISCVDTAARTQIFTCSTPDPIGMTVDARGERLFVSNYAPPQITVLEIQRL